MPSDAATDASSEADAALVAVNPDFKKFIEVSEPNDLAVTHYIGTS